jgi:hypothetical protein
LTVLKGYDVVDGKLVKKEKTKSGKYGNKKVIVDDITFDSIKESEYYLKLKLLKKAGEVIDFFCQKKFPITINGFHIANYFLDFEVWNKDGSKEYVDVKAYDKKTKKYITTDVFQIKKKCVEALYGIKIKIL